MKLCQTKVEEWLSSALDAMATAQKIPVFTASEQDEPTKRPCLFISCNSMTPTEGNLWEDNERTVEVILSLESQSTDSLSKHLAKCVSLELALSDVETVVSFAASVADFYAYDYQVTRTEKGNSDEVRFFELQLSARVRDDDGSGS